MEIKSLEGPSVFLDVIGDSPRNRILDFLLGEISYDFTLKEIARKSKVGYATIKRIWGDFVRSGLVKETRRVGKAVFYTYDKDSKAGRALRTFYLEIIMHEVEKEAEIVEDIAV
ncbi:MAG: hypothetical protein AABX08_01410 [Nanoarchaeota archaeon]